MVFETDQECLDALKVNLSMHLSSEIDEQTKKLIDLYEKRIAEEGG